LTRSVVALTDPAHGAVWLTNVARFVAAFAILVVPSTAMGATLPLLVTALARRRTGFGAALGLVYGWNTLGAVIGVVSAEVWLVGAFGIAGTAWFAAMLSVGAAAIAISPRARFDVPGSTIERTRARTTATSRSGRLDPARTWSLLAC
jgi:predicted membrane-bound spermidine synthase